MLPLIYIFFIIHCTYAYTPPQGFIEPLKPAGLRISIPHEAGISLVAFHINFNKEFQGLEAGQIAVDVRHEENGRWTYVDKNRDLEKDDVIYYWIHVVYKGLGYNLLDQEHKVTDFYHPNGSKVETTVVQAFRPAGFRISIPHTDGISLVAFHININKEFQGKEAGQIATNIAQPKNGQWTYENKHTQLQIGDTVYYWLYIVYNGLGHDLLDQEHRVTEYHDFNGTKIKPWIVQPLKPFGLRISVPHTDGISLVAIHIKINEEFSGLEYGHIAKDIKVPKKGYWTYEDNTTKLNKNDVIYFWIHTIYNNLYYNLVDQEYKVTGFFPNGK